MIQQFGRSNWVIFVLLLVVAHLLYFPTVEAGFVTDFVGFVMRLEGQTAWGILDSFGFPALQPLLNLFLYSFYQLFGTEGLPWYLIYTSLHALNAFLLFRLGSSLLEQFEIKPAKGLALAAAFLFLCSPYQSEAVVWRVCFNFLASTGLLLGMLWLLIRYMEEQRVGLLYTGLGLFVWALFTFELALIAPLFVGLYLLFWGLQFGRIQLVQKAAFRLLLPQFGFIGLYFLLNKFLLGDWVGHYGADVHLDLNIQQLIGNAFKYPIKHLGFVRHWGHNDKLAMFGFFDQTWVQLLGVSLGLLLLGSVAWRWRKITAHTRLIVFSSLAFYIALAPVLTLFFATLLQLENDRYGYFPMAFLALAVVLTLARLPRWLGGLTYFGYLACSIFLLIQTNQCWNASARIYNGLLESYIWEEEERVYLLTLPENYNGFYIFRDHTGAHQGFSAALTHIAQKTPRDTIIEIAQYNLNAITDGSIAQRNQDTLQVELNQWGGWWWRRAMGASNYSTDDYRVRFDGKSYNLQFEELDTTATYLYQVGDHWEELLINHK